MWSVDLLILDRLLPVAAAQARGCEPLDEGSFRDLSVQLRAGIDRGSEVLAREARDELWSGIPCLTFPPTPQQWADVLVSYAIVEHASGGAWEPALTTALQIAPRIDRGVSSRHPFATWEAPEAASGPSLSEPLYVDGVLSESGPGPGGLHLVQKTDGRFWNSVLVSGDALPDGFADDRVAAPPHVAWGLQLGGGGSLQALGQQRSWDSDWVQQFPLGARLYARPGLVARGLATFRSPFGVLGHARGLVSGKSYGAEVSGAAIWRWRGVVLGLGGGAVTLDTWEGPSRVADPSPLAATATNPSALSGDAPDPVHRVHLRRFPLGTIELSGGDRWAWRAGVLSGGDGSLVRVRGGLDLAAPSLGDDGGRWTFGLSSSWVSGTFAQDAAPRNEVESAAFSVGVEVGRWWGELR